MSDRPRKRKAPDSVRLPSDLDAKVTREVELHFDGNRNRFYVLLVQQYFYGGTGPRLKDGTLKLLEALCETYGVSADEAIIEGLDQFKRRKRRR